MVKSKRFLLMIFLILTIIAMTGLVSAAGKTYTLDADFDEGVLFNVEYVSVHDQLQLASQMTALPFIWVPNTGQGTVSKVDTATGKEIGRYRISGYGDPSPSRTTVDLQGNAYVGMRQAGTVVKIGLYENDACVDRNNNGIIDTSQDLNNDGDITGAELLAWGSDECVLYEVVLIDGKQGVFVPGTYNGGYDTNYWGTSPRGLAVDSNNNVWAGTWSSQKFYYLNGATGAILKTVPFGAWSAGQGSYGAVIDGNGILWSSTLNGPVLRIDPAINPPTISSVAVSHYTYGLGLDNLDHLFVTGWESSQISRINVNTGVVDWTKPGPYGARGAASTADNNIWMAVSWGNNVQRYDNNGNNLATVGGFNHPTGVAVDAAGKVWATNLYDNFIIRIDPATNTIDLSKNLIDAGGHYDYSDMTGIVVRSITTKIGTWTVAYDSNAVGTAWGTISWNANTPAGSSVIVRVRSSDDALSWSSWETASNGVPLGATPNGRYIQVESTLQITSGSTSPILYDLTVMPYTDGITDTDGDGIPDLEDNCPTISNSDQLDSNNNGIGDACESIPTPEFPSAFLPVTMIIGFLGAVLLIQRTREH